MVDEEEAVEEELPLPPAAWSMRKRWQRKSSRRERKRECGGDARLETGATQHCSTRAGTSHLSASAVVTRK